MTEHAPPGVDPAVPSQARIYDYLLGGKDNYGPDRAAGQALLEAMPELGYIAKENRMFLVRAVQNLAGSGVRQFLDVGTGLPTVDNVHQVAQRVDPSCRVVYVDNDPTVTVHARALLQTSRQVSVVEADLREPVEILAAAAEHLDFTRPVALLLMAILHFVPDESDPHQIVAELLDALPPGSYLALSHGTNDNEPDKATAATREYSQRVPGNVFPRPYGEIMRFFDQVELIDPGLCLIHRWRPEEPVRSADRANLYGGVGRKRAGSGS